MRLIDADDLIERIKEQYKPQDNNAVANEIVGDIIHNLIEESPTISAINTENCSNGIKTTLAGMKETFRACGL